MSHSSEEDLDDGKTRKTILDKLAQYGDSLLDDERDQVKRTKNRKKKTTDQDPSSTLANQTASKRRKKKKKKAVSEVEAGVDNGKDDTIEDSDGEPKLHGEQRHLEQLKQKLGLNDLDFLKSVRQKQQAQEDKQAKANRGKARPIGKGKRAPPEVIVFEDPAKRNQGKPKKPLPLMVRKRRSSLSDDDFDDDMESRPRRKNPRDSEEPAPEENLIDMRTAKHDVQMFGIMGMEKVDKEKARRDVFYKLGAYAKKNEYVNYKKFQETKKQEKEDIKAQRQVDKALGNRVSKSNNRKARKRDDNDVGFIDGQIGKYKSGVQLVNKREIRKVKMSGGRSSRGGRGGRGGRGRR